jgi:hypothetical protein
MLIILSLRKRLALKMKKLAIHQSVKFHLKLQSLQLSLMMTLVKREKKVENLSLFLLKKTKNAKNGRKSRNGSDSVNNKH